MQSVQLGALIRTVAGLPVAQTPLPLVSGEQMTAFVQAARNDDAVLYLKGTWVTVQHDGLLAEGATIRLQVAGRQQDGTWLLKVLPQPEDVQDSTGVFGKDLTGLLRTFEVEPIPTNLSLAREVIRQGLPLTAGGMQFLAQTGGGLQATPAQASAMVWLWARDLPMTSSTVELVGQVLSTPLIADEAGQWTDFMHRLQAREWPPALAEKVAQLAVLLEQTSVRPGEAPEVTTAKLANLAQTWGLDYEVRLAEVLADNRSASNQPATIHIASAHPAVNHLTTADRADILKQLVETSLKPVLMGLEQMMQSEGETTLADTAHRLAEKVVLLQMVNLGEQRSETPGLVVQGLVVLQDQDVPFYLKVKDHRQNTKEATDAQMQPLQLTVYLNTPRLGQVAGRLTLMEGVLTCEMMVDRASTERVCNNLLPDLRARLEELPWRVNLLPCRLQPPGVVHAANSREFDLALPREGLDVLV